MSFKNATAGTDIHVMHAISHLEHNAAAAQGSASEATAETRHPRGTLRSGARLCGSALCGRDGAIAHSDLAVVGVGLAALLVVRLLSDRYFDAACEAAFALGALCVLETARNLRSFVRDDYPLYLAVSFVAVAALLVLHVAEMPGVALLGHADADLSVRAELAAGLFLAGSLLISPAALGRRLRATAWLAALVPPALLGAAGLFVWRGIPVIAGGQTTTPARVALLLIGALLIAAMLHTYRRRNLLELPFLVALEVALGVGTLGWLCEALLPLDDLKHVLDVAFIALIYVAITKNGLSRPTSLMVANLKRQGQHAQDLVERLAFYDSLTGLANRTLLHDRLRRALLDAERTGSPVAVLHLDLDRFADVNNLLGQRGADSALQEVAACLAPLAAESDTVARLAADEFVLLLPDAEGIETATRVAEQIRGELSTIREVGGRELALTASIGIALYPGDGHDAEELLAHAVIATARAKAAGGDRLQFYDPDMGRAVEARVQLERELRHALEADELVLFYQPQVDLRSGQIVGVEALVRWRHPQRGLLAPDAFLPMAEATGLIEQLTVWVAHQACQQAVAWQLAGHGALRMAINLSARDLRVGHVVGLIDEALRESGLAPRRLEVELTETAIVEDMAATAQQLVGLRARGVSLALDDFGTGFSSLTHLRTLPIQRVKIDRAFVSHARLNERDAAIVASMIGLIHSLGLEAIAEGVESAGDLAFLSDHSCDIAQGYLFSRPLPPDDCAALFGRELLGVELAR